METDFSRLLRDIYDFAVPLRKQRLSAFWLGLSPHGQAALRVELDSKLSSFEITPYDYAFLLCVSKSVDWALHALTSFEYKIVLETGIVVLVSEWKKDGFGLKAAFGGDDVEGIVQLIDTYLPRYITSRLFRFLANSSSLTSQHFHLVDGILKAIFPFLADGQSPPIIRYARSAILSLFMVASPPILLSIVKHCESEWFDGDTLSRLARRRPELVAELLLQHIGAPRSSTSAVVDFEISSPGTLFAALGIVIKSRKIEGVLFFHQFISQYATFVSIQSTSQGKGFSTRVPIADLAKYATFVINKEWEHGAIIRVARAQLDILFKIATAYGMGWSYQTIKPLLHIAVSRFGRASEEWSLLSAEDAPASAGSLSATGLVLSVFKQLPYNVSSLSSLDPLLINSLRKLPRPARFPFLNLLHIAKTGEDLHHMPNAPTSYPQCSSYILSIIHADHARIFLNIGMKSRPDDFAERKRGSTNYTGSFGGLWGVIRAAEAIPAGLHAIQVGSSRSVLRGFNLNQEDRRCINDIDEFKQKASRSRDSRFTYVSAALALCILSRSPGLFVDTLSWAVKRYAKDPQVSPQLYKWIYGGGILDFLAGPPGLFASRQTESIFDLKLLANWCLTTNQTLNCILELLRVWIREPDHQYSIHREYGQLGDFFCDLIQKRMNIINTIFPTLVNNVNELREILLNPIVDLWVQWERMKVFDYPQLLGFDALQNTPCLVSSARRLEVGLRILPVILPFLESVGEEREKLYKTGRAGFPKTLDDATIQSRRKGLRVGASRHFLPMGLNLRGNFKKYEAALSLDGPLGSYLDAVLLDIQTHLNDHDDCYDWHPQQFSEAVQTYLSFSKNGRHRATRIRMLLQKYQATEHANELTALLLGTNNVMRFLLEDGEFCDRLGPFLPDYPPQNAEPIDFDPIPLMPSPSELAIIAPHLLVVLRSLDVRSTGLMENLLACSDSSARQSIRGASSRLIHRLIVFVLAWIFTILDIPRNNNDVTPKGPTSYALKYVRMAQSFMDLRKDYSYPVDISPCSLLRPLLPMISPSEIEHLLDAVFSPPMSPNKWHMAMSILSAVRYLAMPNLQGKHAFKILEKTEASSWHRQVITSGMIASFRPPQARDYIHQLLKFSQDRRAQQKAQGQNVTIPKLGGTSSGPAIKMSTQKMFLQLLVPSFRTGSLDYRLINNLAQSGLLETSAAIVSYLVEASIDVAVTAFVLSGNGTIPKDVQTMLASFVEIAQRFDEAVPESEEGWSAARLAVGPMPENVPTRPIAHALLTSGFRSTFKELWTKLVVEPILKSHVNARTRWLKTAVAREGGSSDLEEAIRASWGSEIAFSNVYTSFAPYFSLRSDDGDETTLQTLSHRVLAFSQRENCLRLRGLMVENHPKGWEHQPYGKTLISLTRYAIYEDPMDTLSCILTSMRDPSTPATVAEDQLSCLMRISRTLLSPENMISPVHSSNQIPFLTVRKMIEQQAMQYVDIRVDRLLNYILDEAEGYERRQSQEKINGGACYWRIILSLKLVLWHHTLANSTIASSVSMGAQYAEGLAAVVNHIVKNRWYGAGFPHMYTNYLRHKNDTKMRVDDYILASRTLSRPPLCPVEPGTIERTLFLETAVAVLRVHKSEIQSSTTGIKLIEELLDEWKKDSDGTLCWLAFSWRGD